MTPRLVRLKEKKLVGHSLKMSLSDNRTGELWGGFAPRIKEVPNRISSTEKYSLQVYPPTYYHTFSVKTEFEKWAVVEVAHFENLPSGMKSFVLPEGLYAVFDYKGSSSDSAIFQYVFFQWLPNSDYLVDDRPHFEVLGTKYKNNDPDSEEEIWIPIKHKT